MLACGEACLWNHETMRAPPKLSHVALQSPSRKRTKHLAKMQCWLESTAVTFPTLSLVCELEAKDSTHACMQRFAGARLSWSRGQDVDHKWHCDRKGRVIPLDSVLLKILCLSSLADWRMMVKLL